MIHNKQLSGIEKSATGIRGLDEITFGGIPKGRPTLICGNAGAGKTVMALEVLLRGATQFHEPGVFIAFEETKEDLVKNIASMGFDLADLIEIPKKTIFPKFQKFKIFLFKEIQIYV